MVRVMIVDDNDIQSQALSSLLQEELDAEVVAQARTATDAVYFADACDVALVNAEAGELDTEDVVSRIAHEHPQVKVLVMGVEDPEVHVNGLLDFIGAGACGYITIADSKSRALRKIQAAYEDRALISPKFALRLMRHLSAVQSQHSARPGISPVEVQRLAHLTPRQCEVLHLIAEGYSNADIAEELGITVGTAKNHVSRILKVLGVPNRERAARVYLWSQQKN